MFKLLYIIFLYEPEQFHSFFFYENKILGGIDNKSLKTVEGNNGQTN